MKIIHCIFSLNTGGAETMLIDILNEQVKTEEVAVIIINDSYQPELVQQINKEVKTIFIHRRPSSRSVLPIIKLNWILFRLAPDVVHLHHSFLSAIIFSIARNRLFLTVHALRVSVKHVPRKSNIIAISEAVKEDVLKKRDSPIFTIPNGININCIEKRDMHIISENSRMRIIQVARLDASEKGQDILIKAIAILQQRGFTNFEVDFIGEGASEDYLRQLAEECCVSDKIHFLGLRDRQYIYTHLKDYDLMCHPARYEGFGLTIAEAMAAMLPVLVPNDGGPYEIIRHGELGYVMEMENSIDCADKIELIYHSYNKALARASLAYQHVSRNYSVGRMVYEYIKAYKLILHIKQREINEK